MQIVNFKNPGAIIDRLPDELFEKTKIALKQKREQTNTLDTPEKRNMQILSIKEIDGTPYIKELDEFVRKTYVNWCQTFEVFPGNVDKIHLNLWTNYMKRGEYIPIHNHSSDISFVIWIAVPYNRKDEEKYHFEHIEKHPPPPKIAKNPNGTFQFVYSTFYGTLTNHMIDLCEENEGEIIMFHSSLFHIVYPFFSSDKDRISIAGNIKRI